MTRPRQILPGRIYMLTRRCTQRQYLLRPDAASNQTFLYCLAEAAERFEIQVLLPQQMSNHHHTIFHDPKGTAVEFTEHFHKMVARSQNALRGRWENFWSSEPPCLVHLVDVADVLDKLVYVATNPVKAHLVERVHQWPGVDFVGALLKQRALRVERPRHFFRSEGSMPESVTLTLGIPAELGELRYVLEQLQTRIAAVEDEHIRCRVRNGSRILGRRNVVRQSWRDSPASREPRRTLRPRLAARCKWRRLEAIRCDKAFVTEYREARAAMIAGHPIPFPIGTYWLRRFAAVPIAGESRS